MLRFYSGFCRNIKSHSKVWMLAVILLMYFSDTSKAQVANYSFAQSPGVYTPITGGTVLATATANTIAGSMDSEIYTIAAASFPFTFDFNGIGYTGCVVNSNGYITFGATPPSAFTTGPISSTTTYAGAISAWARDINGMFNLSSRTSEIRWETVGTTPNREVVIQFKDFRPNYTTSTTSVYAMNFQFRLQENGNKAVIVYGEFINLLGTTNYSGTTQVGLRGATNADFNNRTGTSWATTTAGTANNNTVSHQTVTAPINVPTSGLTFTWSPPPACAGMPTAGTAVASVTTTCPGGSSDLSVTGATSGVTGITYKWQRSPDNVAPYVDIVGANTAAYTATNITATGFYRAVVTCTPSGLSANSVPVQINVSGASAVPYFEGFEGITANDELPSCWAISNPTINKTYITNGTNNRIPRTGTKFGSFRYGTAAAGDYFYTTAIQLTAGETYKASAWYVTDGAAGWSEFSLLYGTTQSTTGLVSIATAPSPITNMAYQELSGDFVAPTTGVYYIAIRAVGNFTPWYLSFDDVSLSPVVATDIAAVSANVPSTCYSPSVPVSFVIKNNGSAPLDFSANNAVATVNVTGQITQTLTLNINDNTLNGGVPLAAGASLTLSMGNVNMSAAGTYNFLGDIVTAGDLVAGNNAMSAPFVRTLATPLPLNYVQGFDANTTVPYTQNSGSWSINSSANRGGVGETNGLLTNMWGTTTNSTPRITLPIIGPITAGAVLTYAYRFTDYNSTDVATFEVGDYVKVQVSTDCGATFTDLVTYNSVTHTPISTFQTANIPLGAYVGQNIVLRIDALKTAASGIDIDLVFDNINIKLPCPAVATVTTYPYLESFDGVVAIADVGPAPAPLLNPTNGAMPCGWTVENTNNDVESWYNFNGTTATASSPNAIVNRWNPDATTPANDWAFTPPLAMIAGRTYTVSFKAKASDAPAFVEGVEVRWGTAANSASMLVANTIYDNSNVNNAGFVTFTATVIAPPTTGNYFVGFLSKSVADQGILYIDDVQITESCPTVTITTASLPNGSGGVAYSQTPAQTGLTGAVTWTVSAGALPTGLSLNASTGAITGTPTALGTSSFTLQVAQGTCNATKALSITIDCPATLVFSPLAAAGLPDASIDGAYTTTVSQSTLPAVTWGATGLPAGLTMNAATGVISGTATATSSSTVVVTATGTGAFVTCSASVSYNLDVVCPTLVFGTTTAPDGALATAYSLDASVTGATAAVTYSVLPALPAGLTLNTTTGAISGTPTAVTASATYTVSATQGTCTAVTQGYTFEIVCAVVTISPASIPSGVLSTAYTQIISQTGFTAPVVWSVSTGTLPAGLALNAATGEISGTPTAAGLSNFTIAVTKAACTITKPYSINVTSTAPSPSTTPTLSTPATPTNFTATAVSTTQINLSWNAVQSNVVEYQLYQGGVLIATLPVGTTTYQVTGLDSNTLYSFTIVAVNRGSGQTRTSTPNTARDWTFPETPSLLSVRELCVEGNATVQVNSGGSVYRIYDELTGGTLLLESANGTFELPYTNQDTTFFVAVLGFGGDESERLAVSVTVADAFEAVILGESTRFSCESTLLLEAQVVEGASFYQWYLNDQPFSQGQTLTATSTGYYKLLVRKGNCNVVSERVLVKLNQNPIAQIRENNGVQFCENGTINAVDAGSGASYEWLLNNAVVGQGESLSVSQSGTYTLEVTQNGCSASSTVAVVVTNTPAVPVLSATETTICPSVETIISVQNIESGVVYQWFRNGRNIRQTGSSISTSTQGNYQVVAVSSTNSSCSVSSSELQINRFDVESIYLRISDDKKILFLEDANGTQDAVASVEWYFEGESNAGLGPVPSITPTEDGNYSALVTTPNGCMIQTRTVYFAVPRVPVITGEEDLTTDLFKIYPNPSKGIFKVQFPAALTENIQVSVFDATGKVIKTQIFEKNNQDFVIDIQGMSKGMYLIRFNQNDSVYSKSIIVE